MGGPDIDTILMGDSVLVQVIPSFLSTHWRGEEVGVVVSFQKDIGQLDMWRLDMGIGE